MTQYAIACMRVPRRSLCRSKQETVALERNPVLKKNKTMKKLRLYIETSVRNFLFADDATEKRAVTELLFHETESGNIFFVHFGNCRERN